MAPIVMGIAAVAGAFMSYKQAKAQKEAGKEAQALANKNAALEQADTERQLAVLQAQQAEDAGRRRATAAASGVGGATQTAFLAAQAGLEEEDRAYVAKAGKSRAQIASAKGTLAKHEAYAGAMGTYGKMVGQLGSAAGSFARAG